MLFNGLIQEDDMAGCGNAENREVKLFEMMY